MTMHKIKPPPKRKPANPHPPRFKPEGRKVPKGGNTGGSGGAGGA